MLVAVLKKLIKKSSDHPSSHNVKNVLFLIPTLQGGGAERVFTSLLQHIDRSKFNLSLAVIDMRDAMYKSDIPQDVEIIDMGCLRVRQAIPKIISLIWQRRPDIVFTTLGHLNLAIAMLRPLLPNNVRYIARESSIVSHLPTAYKVPFWWFWAYRIFYPRLDAVVCQSRDMRDDLIYKFKFPIHKVFVIHNPVDKNNILRLANEMIDGGAWEKDRGQDTTVNILSVGRLTFEKGFDLLIGAIALCNNPRFNLTLLGVGPMQHELESLAVSNGLGGQVRFLGFKKNPYPYLARADVFVLSSRFDGFPNVVLEAMACGTPVIATPAPGGVREILEGVEGCVLTESISAISLANALINFTKGRRLQSNTVAAYSIESIVGQYERIFLATLN